MKERPEIGIVPPGTTGVVTVDLGRLAANWRALAALVAPAACAAVVKADAYGLGAEACIPALVRAGCPSFFVATCGEGEAARPLAGDADIFVLDGSMPGSEALLAEHQLIPVLSSLSDVSAFHDWAKSQKARPPVALHLCSGLNRLGLPPGEIDVLATHSDLLAHLDVRLVMSHLAAADIVDDPKNARQLAAFERVRRLVPKARASLAASDGLMLGKPYHFDLVRPGYALYGGQPSRFHRAPVEPVVSVHARILQVREVAVGEAVGYSGIWEARRPSRIATIAAGYADGIPRTASRASDGPGGSVAIGGKLAPIVGRVSMDLVTVDVTDIAPGQARPGDWAEIVGPTITLEDAGAAAGTIGYEILTRLGRRFHRVYLGGA